MIESEIEIYDRELRVWANGWASQLKKGVRFRQIAQPEMVMIVTSDEFLDEIGIPVRIEAQ